MRATRRASLRTAGLLLGAAAMAAGLAACGDDDGGGGTGSDEDYVAAICAAAGELNESFQDIVADATGDESPEEAAELLLGPFDDYAVALRDANPPADLVDYHEELLDRLDDGIERLRAAKDPDALDDAPELPDPPAEAQDRLQPLIDANADCREAEFEF